MVLGQLEVMRLVRSFVVTAMTVTVGAGAHVLAGGHFAPGWLIALALCMGWPVLFALSTRRWSFLQVLAFMALTQVVMHTAMEMAMPTAAHDHVSGLVTQSAPDTSMAVFHLVATVLLSLAVAVEEWALHWSVRIVRLMAAIVPTPERPFARMGHLVVHTRRELLRAHEVAGRAPPSGPRLRSLILLER